MALTFYLIGVNERILAVELESSRTYSAIKPPFVTLFLFFFLN